MDALRVVNVTKDFGATRAADNLSFHVRTGSCTALLGGNGAGKTTCISMLLGLLLPSSGQIHVLGTDMVKDRYGVLPRLNFCSPYVDLPHRLSVRQNLAVFGKLYGVKDLKSRIEVLANDLDLHEILDRPAGKLSAGQKTRVTLAKALLNTPDLLLLDEPTASLDPDTADWVRHYFLDYQRKTKATILLASHNMAEVERMCDHVIMMARGKIQAQGSPQQLIQDHQLPNLEAVFLKIARAEVGGAS